MTSRLVNRMFTLMFISISVCSKTDAVSTKTENVLSSKESYTASNEGLTKVKTYNSVLSVIETSPFSTPTTTPVTPESISTRLASLANADVVSSPSFSSPVAPNTVFSNDILLTSSLQTLNVDYSSSFASHVVHISSSISSLTVDEVILMSYVSPTKVFDDGSDVITTLLFDDGEITSSLYLHDIISPTFVSASLLTSTNVQTVASLPNPLVKSYFEGHITAVSSHFSHDVISPQTVRPYILASTSLNKADDVNGAQTDIHLMSRYPNDDSDTSSSSSDDNLEDFTSPSSSDDELTNITSTPSDDDLTGITLSSPDVAETTLLGPKHSILDATTPNPAKDSIAETISPFSENDSIVDIISANPQEATVTTEITSFTPEENVANSTSQKSQNDEPTKYVSPTPDEEEISSSSPQDDDLEETATDRILALSNITTGIVNNDTTTLVSGENAQLRGNATTAQNSKVLNESTTNSNLGKDYNDSYGATNNSYRTAQQTDEKDNSTKLQPTSTGKFRIGNEVVYSPMSSYTVTSQQTFQSTFQESSSTIQATLSSIANTQSGEDSESFSSMSTSLLPTPVLESMNIVTSSDKYASTLMPSYRLISSSVIPTDANTISSFKTPHLTQTDSASTSPSYSSSTTNVEPSISSEEATERGYVFTVMFSIDPELYAENWKVTQTVFVESASISPDIDVLNVNEVSPVVTTTTTTTQFLDEKTEWKRSDVETSSLLQTEMIFDDSLYSDDLLPCNCTDILEGEDCNCNETDPNETLNSNCDCDVLNSTAEVPNNCSCAAESLEVALQTMIYKSSISRFRNQTGLVPINFEVRLKPRSTNDNDTSADPAALWFLINNLNRTRNPPIPFTCTCKINIKPNGNPSIIHCSCNDITTTTTTTTTTTPAPSTAPACNCSMPEDLRPIDCECNDTEVTTLVPLCPCLNQTQYFCNCTIRPPPCLCDEIELSSGVFLKYNCRCTYEPPTPMIPIKTLERCYCERKALVSQELQLLNCTCPGILNATLVLLSPLRYPFNVVIPSPTTDPTTTTLGTLGLEPCNGNDIELTNGIFLGLACKRKLTTTTTNKPDLSSQCVHQEIRVSDELSLKVKASCNILQQFVGMTTRRPVYSDPPCSCIPEPLSSDIVMKMFCSCFKDGVLKNNLTIIVVAPEQIKRFQRDQNDLPTVSLNSDCQCEEVAIQSNLVLKVNCDCNKSPTPELPTTSQKTQIADNPFNDLESMPRQTCLCQYEIAPGFLVNIKNTSCDCANKIVRRSHPPLITPQPETSSMSAKAQTTTSAPTTTVKHTTSQISSTDGCKCVDRLLAHGKVFLVNCSCDDPNQNVVVLSRPNRSNGKRETETEPAYPVNPSKCDCEEVSVMPGVVLKVNCDCTRNTEIPILTSGSPTDFSELPPNGPKSTESQNLCKCDEFYPYPNVVLLYNCVCEMNQNDAHYVADDTPQQDALETSIPSPLLETDFEIPASDYQERLVRQDGNCVCDEIGPSTGQVLRLNCSCSGDAMSIFVVKDNNTVVKERGNGVTHEETDSVSQSNRIPQNELVPKLSSCSCSNPTVDEHSQDGGLVQPCNCSVDGNIRNYDEGRDVITIPATEEVTSPLTKNCSCDSVIPPKMFKVVRRHVPNEVSVVLCSCNLTEVQDHQPMPPEPNISTSGAKSPEEETTTSTAATTTTMVEATEITTVTIQTTSDVFTDLLTTAITVLPEETYDQMFWIRTVVRVENRNYTLANVSLMENKLASAYAQAFHRRHQERLHLNRRQRRQVVGIVTTKTVKIERYLDRANEFELIYVVKSDGQPVEAKYAVKDMDLIDNQTMAEFLNHTIIIKAEEYLKLPTESTSEPVIATIAPGLSSDALIALAVCIPLLIILLLLLLCLLCAGKKKKRKNKYNQKQVFEETGGVITGPGDSKVTTSAPRPLQPSPKGRPKRSPPRDKLILETDSSASSLDSLKTKRLRHKRKDTSPSATSKKGKTKGRQKTRKRDLEASLEDSGLPIESPESERSGQALLLDETKPRKKRKEKRSERIKPLDVLRKDDYDTLSGTNGLFDYLNQPDVIAVGQSVSSKPPRALLPPIRNEQHQEQLGLRLSLDYSPRPDVPKHRISASPRQGLPHSSHHSQTRTPLTETEFKHRSQQPVPKPRTKTKQDAGSGHQSSPSPQQQYRHSSGPEVDDVAAMLAAQDSQTCPAEFLIRNIREELQKFKSTISEDDEIHNK